MADPLSMEQAAALAVNAAGGAGSGTGDGAPQQPTAATAAAAASSSSASLLGASLQKHAAGQNQQAQTQTQPTQTQQSYQQNYTAQTRPNPNNPTGSSAPRSRRTAAPPPQTPLPPSTTRPNLNGSWLLIKNGRGNPSLRPFLEAMNVDHLAVEAAEKGEQDFDTVQDITLTDKTYRIHKQSRVNDLVLELVLGQAKEEELPKHPAAGTRTRRSLATSDHLRHVRIESTLVTVSGTADVVDVKTLHEETGGDGRPLTVMQQILTIHNRHTKQEHTTTRYFVPYDGNVEKAATAGGSRRDRGELGPPAAKKKGGKGRTGPSAQEVLARQQQEMRRLDKEDPVVVPKKQPEMAMAGGHFTRSAGPVPDESSGGGGGEDRMEE